MIFYRKCKQTLIKRYKTIFAVLLLIVVLQYTFFPEDNAHQFHQPQDAIENCYTSDLAPFDPEILHHLKNKSYTCRKSGPELVSVNGDVIDVIAEEYVNPKHLHCEYRNRTLWISLAAPTKLNFDSVEVRCYSGNRLVYTNHLPLRRPPKMSPVEPAEDAADVLVVLLRGVSRMAFLRRMPKTRAALAARGGVDFLRMNAVGLNPLEGALPIVKGCAYKDFGCLRSEEFVWDEFQWSGYITGYLEDAVEESTFAKFKKLMFDYDWRRMVDVEKDHGHEWSLYGHPFCVRSRRNHQVLLDYASGVFLEGRRAQRPVFVLLVTNAARDAEEKLTAMDDDFSDFFRHLGDVFVFVVGDHGGKHAALSGTPKGFLERSLPVAYVAIPRWVKELRPNVEVNLRGNADVVVSPYDVHEALLRVLNVNLLDVQRKRKTFFDVLNGNRTCEDAGVPPELCACTRSKIGDGRVNRAAKSAISYLNQLLVNTECLRLKLESIVDARFVKEGRIIIVYFRTKPDAYFEAHVKELRWSMDVVRVVRLESDFREGRCVVDHQLREICICPNDLLTHIHNVRL